MASLLSSPKAPPSAPLPPQTPQLPPLPDPAPSSARAAPAPPAAEAAPPRRASLARRRLGTIATSPRGLLRTTRTAPRRKTLLGE
jgi:hypothetical protein